MNEQQDKEARKQSHQRAVQLLSVCAVVGLAASCATTKPATHVSGQLAGVSVESTTSCEAARYYLEHYLRGERTNPALHAHIDRLHQRFVDRLPDRYELAEISAELSNDFGALFFSQLITQQPQNRLLQQKFLDEVAAAQLGATHENPYEVILAPAWLHRDRPETGATLHVPAAAFKASGVKTHIVPAIQDATVEENAAIIADTVRGLAATGKEYLIVSVSKSGAEVALALGELLQREESRHVRGWINISGSLRGTPLVEEMFAFPYGLAARPMFWVNGWNIEGAQSMIPSKMRPRFDRLNLPDDLVVVNMVGVPMSEQLTSRGKEAAGLLDAHGPHDGVTLIADSLVPGQPTIVALGLDHYFATPELPQWTQAVYSIMAQNLTAMAFNPPPGSGPAAPWRGDERQASLSFEGGSKAIRFYCAGPNASGGSALCAPPVGADFDSY